MAESSTAERTTSKQRQRGRTLQRVFKRVLWVVVGAGVVAGVVVTAMPKPVGVERQAVARGELLVTIDEDGKTRVKDRYVVSAPLSGNLGRIELRAGDEVKQGEVLARLVPLRAPLLDARSRSQTEAQVAAALASTQQVKAQIERARAALEYAKSEAARYDKLFKQNAVSQMELDRAMLEKRARTAEMTSAEFGAKVAAHELRMARAALGRYDEKESTESLTIPSPISGLVLKVIQQSEGVVQAGTPLIEIGDPKALEIVVDVLTSDAVHITPGSPATIEEWGGPSLQAAVRTIEPSAFTRLSALGVEEQRVNAVVDLTAPYDDWSKLGDGYRVEARIEIFRTNDVLTIPLSAMFRHDGNWAVFIDDGGVAKLRAIQVGRRNDTVAEVASGLAEGDVVIVHPSDNVIEGVKLEPL